MCYWDVLSDFLIVRPIIRHPNLDCCAWFKCICCADLALGSQSMELHNVDHVRYFVQCGILSSTVFCPVWYFVQYGIITTGILTLVLWPAVFCTAVFWPRYFVRGILSAGILTHWYFDPGILSEHPIEWSTVIGNLVFYMNISSANNLLE